MCVFFLLQSHFGLCRCEFVLAGCRGVGRGEDGGYETDWIEENEL